MAVVGAASTDSVFPYVPSSGLRKHTRQAVLDALHSAKRRFRGEGSGAGAGAGVGAGAGASAGTDVDRPVVLVLDAVATQMLDSLFTASELADSGFVVLDPLLLDRQAYPAFDAVYFMVPSTDNIKRMIADFNFRPWQDDTPPDMLDRCLPVDMLSKCLPCCFKPLPPILADPLYHACTLVAICGITDAKKKDVIEKVTTDDGMVDKFTDRFRDVDCLYFEAVVPEPNLFLLDVPDAFSTLHMQGTGVKVREMKNSVGEDIAKRLASVCFTLGKGYPDIRYTDGGHCSAIAHCVEARLNILFRYKEPRHEDVKKRNLTLLIVDRVEDMITPFLHDFGYQSLCSELPFVAMFKPFNMPLQSSRGSSKRTQKAIFNEQDPVWVKLRHLHFLDAYKLLEQGREQVAAQDREAERLKEQATRGGGGTSGNRVLMQLAASVMTRDANLVSKLNLHTNMIRHVNDAISNNNITYDTSAPDEPRNAVHLCKAESCLASGENLNEGTLSLKDAKHIVTSVLENQRHPIVEDDQLRLLAVFWLATARFEPRAAHKRKGKIESFVQSKLGEEAYRDLLQLKTLPFDMERVMSVRAESQSERVQASFGPKKDPLLLQHTPFIVDVARLLLANALPHNHLGFGTLDTMPPQLRAALEREAQMEHHQHTSASNAAAESRIKRAAGSEGPGGDERSDVGAVVESRRKTAAKQYDSTAAVDLSSLNLGVDESKDNGSSRMNDPERTLVVFVTGGISAAETRALEAISATRPNLQIFYGSTNYMSPALWLTELTKLDAANNVADSSSDEQSDASDTDSS